MIATSLRRARSRRTPAFAAKAAVRKPEDRIIRDVDWLEAADNYVKAHANGETHVIRRTLQRLEESLSPRGFVRVHR